MAAAATDKARKSYSYLQKTLNGGISDVATFLTPNNVNNIPTDTGVSFVVDRVDSSGNKTPTLRELMTGVVSAGNIVGLIRGEQGTTQQAHLNNAVIEFVNSGEMWNDLIDFLLQDHSNPNGNHKTLTDDNSNEWLERGSVASAVNQVKITNAITGNPVRADASGDDTNTDFYLGGKGTGVANVENPELTANFIASGGVVAISSGLIGTFSNMVHYVSGKRYKKTTVANKTYTASKDTYVDADSTSSATVTYTEVANGAAAPALAAGSIRIAKVVTGASITSITQTGTDSLGNSIANRNPANANSPSVAKVATGETSTSSTYADLATVTDSVTVNIGLSGAAWVAIGCNAGNASTGGYVYMSFAVSGATTVAAGANSNYAAAQEPGASASSFYPLSGMFLVTGLTPGVNTFKAKYKVTAASTGTFLDRQIAVQPIA